MVAHAGAFIQHPRHWVVLALPCTGRRWPNWRGFWKTDMNCLCYPLPRGVCFWFFLNYSEIAIWILFAVGTRVFQCLLWNVVEQHPIVEMLFSFQFQE